MAAAGVELMGSTPQEFGHVIASELPKYAKVMKDAGMQPE
jgi:tripartite-type tricarboxylate transporter receptor subunit TctC